MDGNTYAPTKDYSYSRPLDIQRWSEDRQAAALVRRIQASCFNPSLSATQLRHFRVLTLNLYEAWKADSDLCLAIHRNRNDYSVDPRYNPNRITATMIEVVDRMIDAGLIEQKLGFNDKREGGKGKTSRIWPTPKLIDEFRRVNARNLLIRSHPRTETIRLKDGDKKLIEYPNIQKAERMRKVLDSYNKLLSRTHIDCSHLDNPYVENKDGSRVAVGAQSHPIYRVFNNGSFKQGGRFYGGWWEQIGEEHRKHIRISGERTVETDFKALHVGLLYAEEGLSFWDLKGSSADPYEIEVEGLVDQRKLRRWLVKNLILIGVNAANEAKAFGALRKKVEDDDKADDLPNLDNKYLKKVLDRFRDEHPLIADRLCSGSGLDMQYLDSQITERVIKHFTHRSIPVLSVHDSYVIGEGHAVELHEVMCQEWVNVSGLPLCPDDVFGENPSPGILQHGYTGELEGEDAEGHQRLLKMQESEYVSERYRKGKIEWDQRVKGKGS